MNEDEYWLAMMAKVMYGSNALDNYRREYETFDGLSASQAYDLLTSTRTGMPYYNSYDSYNNYTRGDEVATAVLEAYSNGVDFETLIKKNSTVRQYWYQVQSDKAAKEKARIKELERQTKLAEKRAIEKAKQNEVLAKLTDEELEAFGFIKLTNTTRNKVTKR